MQAESKTRDARMMEAIAGLGGRSALSSEVDIRLGVVPSKQNFPDWLHRLAQKLSKRGTARRETASVPLTQAP